MTIKFKSARQEPLTALLNLNFADPTTYGTAENAIEVPQNAILIGGGVTVVTAWNSATTATLKLGDAADDDRYTSSAIDLKTAGYTPLTLTGYKHTVAEFLKALVAQTGAAATAGDARLVVTYVVEGRACTAQGLDFRAVGVRGA
ncbi:MAG: hypothetical protein ACREVL_00890 [Solimonas sp.]